ncbi:response regulator transcription factor [Neorhizobium sp. T7_12]|uniref:response regulator transcription factor n=1 Tax=Neorhizobium sp. T7_12 TaxID=2093832 RepID=UPI000CF947BA|nr:response regulator [Neorhizobium sp. T7_12]
MPHSPIIAIVDDDAAIREALESLVQSCGYESRLFVSAEDFLAYEDRAAINCMLLDVNMPGLTGLELQDRLNKEPSTPPIIFMTSYQDETSKRAAIGGGALAFLPKPVDVNRLIDVIEIAIRS